MQKSYSIPLISATNVVMVRLYACSILCIIFTLACLTHSLQNTSNLTQFIPRNTAPLLSKALCDGKLVLKRENKAKSVTPYLVNFWTGGLRLIFLENWICGGAWFSPCFHRNKQSTRKGTACLHDNMWSHCKTSTLRNLK